MYGIPNTIEDFWRNVEKSEGCWLWMMSKTTQGYGQFSYGGKLFRAHRFVAQIILGLCVDGLDVCHKCDNPSCVNPDHLFIGTRQDNLSDMVSKNRQASGEKNGVAILTEEDVLRIRSPEFDGVTHAKVAEEFGTSVTNVSVIRNGLTWKHLL